MFAASLAFCAHALAQDPAKHDGSKPNAALAGAAGAMAAVALTLPPEKKTVVLEKVEDLVRRHGADSCEARYYGLFAKPAPAKRFTEETRREDFKAAELVFVGIQRSFESTNLFRKLRRDNPDLAREWAARLSRARFIASADEGAFARFVESSGEAIGTEKNVLGEPVRKLLDKEGRPTDSPTVLWRQGSITPDTRFGKHFVLAHESTHLMNWASPTTQACLMKPDAAAARKGLSARDLRSDSDAMTPTERAFAQVAWGTDAQAADKLPAVAKDAKRFQELWARCRRSRLPSLFDEGFSDGDILRERLFERDPERMRRLLDEILREDPKLFERLKEREKRKEPPAKQERKDGIDTRTGWGTTPFVQFEDCLKQDTVSSLELFALVKKYKLPGFTARELFADQRVETVADFYATEMTVEEIEALPADKRKAAAEDVLRALPPTMYPDDARAALDYVGSKKTNEGRVFGILLANPKFRDILGCKFSKTTPKYCGGE